MKKTITTIIAIMAVFLAARAEGNSMPQLHLTYDETALNYDSYIRGTMELEDTDGTVWSLPAKFKTRGATARQYFLKPSLNMKLEDADGRELDTNLLGLREASSFILDAMAIDRINMRNRVAFDIWNDFSRLPYKSDFEGRNGTVGKFVETYVNGAYKGIYCLSDKINRKLLNLKKPKDEGDGGVTIRGVLYKNGTNDIEDQNTPGYFNDYMVYVAEWHDAWELHEPEDYASEAVWAPLADLYRDMNYENYDYVRGHFHMENLADFAVHTIALGIADNWGNKNKYFSIQDITADEPKFVVTPWDLDTALGGEFDGSRYGDNLKTEWGVEEAFKKIPIPLSICFSNEEFVEMMRESWLRGREGALSVESVRTRMQAYAADFIESGAWERTLKARNGHDLTVDDLEQETANIASWYEARFRDMDRHFNVSPDDTGIEATGTESRGPEPVYNIQGMPVRDMATPGLYIAGGRKIIIK